MLCLWWCFSCDIILQFQKFVASDRLWWQGLARILTDKGFIREGDDMVWAQGWVVIPIFQARNFSLCFGAIALWFCYICHVYKLHASHSEWDPINYKYMNSLFSSAYRWVQFCTLLWITPLIIPNTWTHWFRQPVNWFSFAPSYVLFSGSYFSLWLMFSLK